MVPVLEKMEDIIGSVSERKEPKTQQKRRRRRKRKRGKRKRVDESVSEKSDLEIASNVLLQ